MSPGALVVPHCAIKRELQSLRGAGKGGGGGGRRQGEAHGEITRLGIARGGNTGERESRSEQEH